MKLVELLKKCGLALEAELSGDLLIREKIRSQLMPTNPPGRDLLNRSAHLRREVLNVVEPTPHACLGHRLAGDLGELSSQSALASRETNGALHGFQMISHATEFDKYACLVQQGYLSGDDRQIGHPYCAGMDQHDWKTLAGRLAWAMGKREWNDKELAKRVNERHGLSISWQTIQSIRNGGTGMSTYVAHLAQALECDAIWLATGDGEPYVKGISAGIAGDLTVAAVAIAKRWQNLSPSLRAKVVDVLVAYESLAESETPSPEPGKARKRPASVT